MAQPEDKQSSLAALTDALFFRALEWVRRSGKAMAVETTLVGTVSGALSQVSLSPCLR